VTNQNHTRILNRLAIKLRRQIPTVNQRNQINQFLSLTPILVVQDLKAKTPIIRLNLGKGNSNHLMKLKILETEIEPKLKSKPNLVVIKFLIE
jgi:hypothetical protein